MNEPEYNPKPIFKAIASSLVKAMEEKNWDKVKELYEDVKNLSKEYEHEQN